MPVPPIFFLPENSFFGYLITEVQKERKKEKKSEVSVRERSICMLRISSNQSFVFLALLLYKLKFLIPIVNFASPTVVINHIMSMHTSIYAPIPISLLACNRITTTHIYCITRHKCPL